MTLTNDFCNEYYAQCSTQLALPVDYCEYRTGGDVDQFYAYPLVVDGERLLFAKKHVAPNDHHSLPGCRVCPL